LNGYNANSIFLAGSIEWNNLLAIHEGRHMDLFDRLFRFYHLLDAAGEYAVLGLTVWHTPMWFFEGDASESKRFKSAAADANRNSTLPTDFTVNIQLLL
jgi:hypothetical protein